MSLLAVVSALTAIYQTWRGNVVGAVVIALNGITVALVALGFRMHAQDVTRFMLARGGLIHGPDVPERDEVPVVLRRGH